MKEKINIAELLKDCPKGTKLYSPLCGECRVIKVYNYLGFDVINGTDDVFNFSYDGRYNLMGECCIFPSKDQRDWSKFQQPFKDGDVVVDDSGATFLYKQIHTYYEEPYADFYCGLTSRLRHFVIKTSEYQRCGKISDSRLAREEEKQELFDAIKANGYVWNEETKTLEKLIEPGFKIGNRIKSKINQYEYTIIDITKDSYIVRYKTDKFDYHVPFCDENNFDLIPDKFDVTTLKPFESRVLVRSSMDGLWKPAVFGFRNGYNDNAFYIVGGSCWKQCIPYMNNEHLCGTTNDCDEYFKTWEK